MSDPLDFATDGAALFTGAALSFLPQLDALAASLPRDQAGIRLYGLDGLPGLLGKGSPCQHVAARLSAPNAFPVRAILFDKTPSANWSLGWHQDRSLAVRHRVDTPGFGPWTVKQGIQHVQPPFEVIEQMVTLRIHLDDTPIANAPLLIVRGSHRLGRIPEPAIEAITARGESYACLAARGDIWAYSTPILHASSAGTHDHRRVLQVDYATSRLPGALEWLGI